MSVMSVSECVYKSRLSLVSQCRNIHLHLACAL